MGYFWPVCERFAWSVSKNKLFSLIERKIYYKLEINYFLIQTPIFYIFTLINHEICLIIYLFFTSAILNGSREEWRHAISNA